MNIGLSTSVIGRGKTGIAQYVFGLVRALEYEMGEHRLFLFVLEEDLPLFEFAKSFATIVPVSERFRAPVKNIFWHHFILPVLIKKLAVEVFHVPSYRRMLWTGGCAHVATIHDLAPFRLQKKYEWKRMIYGRVAARWLALRQAQIIAVSQTTASDIIDFFKIPTDRINVIFNGIDHQRFSLGDETKAREEVFARFGLAAPYFLYVARLEHPAKNHCRLIEAFNQFKARTHSDWKLALAGSDWQAAEVIHQAIGSSPYAAEIRCLGFVDDQELPSLYRAAGIFIYPSLFEGFGLPPIEAMACGCPVIASSRGALGEILGNAAEIIIPEQSESIAEAMIALVTDTNKCESLRRGGRQRAQNFDWQKNARATMQVYARAAARLNLNSLARTRKQKSGEIGVCQR